MTKKYLVEFIGTLFLLLVVALTGNPIAIGVVLVALVYMGGYISGAHYNPAVTLSLLINKKIPVVTALKYMSVQFLGGIVAALLFFIIRGKAFVPAPNINSSFGAAILIEILFTFLLCSVILHVAATEKTKGNDYFGLAIGFTLMAAAFAGGPISGGAFNPAVGVSPLLFDIANISGHFVNILLYLLGPFTGGLLAGLTYKYLEKLR